MKKFSAPPMIIILDVLFVVLFILVLEQSPNIKVELPQKVWLKDTIVVDDKIEYFFNDSKQKWENLNKLPKRTRIYDNIIVLNTLCEKNQFCKKVTPYKGKIKKIAIKGDLYDEISSLMTDSCFTFPKECSNVTYHIKDNGRVDRERLKNEFPIFKDILLEDNKH